MNVRDGNSFKYYPKREGEKYEDFVAKNLPQWLSNVAMKYAVQHNIPVEEAVRLTFYYFVVLQDLIYFKHHVSVGGIHIRHGINEDYEQRLDKEAHQKQLLEGIYPEKRAILAAKFVKKLIKEHEAQLIVKPKKEPTPAQIERKKKKTREWHAAHRKKQKKAAKKKYFWNLLNENC